MDNNRADPARIRTLGDLKRELDLLRRMEGRRLGKDRLSVRDLTRSVERNHDRQVPRSTLANYLAGRTLPPPNVYEAILRALGVTKPEMRDWADAWDRLYDERNRPAEKPEPEPQESEPDPVLRRKRALLAVGVLVVLVAGGTVAVVALTSTAPPKAQPAAKPTALPVETGECAYSPVAVPIRVRPRASFGTGTEFRTIGSLTQVVVGGCRPVKAELGTSCSATLPVAPGSRSASPIRAGCSRLACSR